MAARLYLELQQRYSWHQGTISRSIQFGWDLSLGKEVVKLDSHTKAGISFESRSGTALPFKLDVVVKAFWKFFGHRDGDKDCISYNDFSTDSLARSFALKTDFGGVSSKLLGKYTCRKFITEDEVTLVWIECADVENFGGVTFSGMQYLKRGYLRLRKIHQEGPGQQSTSTIAETFTETTPIFREGADNLAIQTQDLISVVKRSYNEVNAVFCQTMNNLLLEEDWKIEIQKDTPA